MEAMTVFRAKDGSRWDCEADAIEREKLLIDVARAMYPLGDRPKALEDDKGYVQHEAAAVMRAKAALIELTRPFLKEWMRTQEQVHGRDLMQTHGSWFGRLLDGGCDPLERAWSRMCCIDGDNREWQQPYFASNPGTGKQVCLNK